MYARASCWRASGSVTRAGAVRAAGRSALPPTASPPIDPRPTSDDALVHQRRDRDLPAVALAAEHPVVATRASLKNTSLNSASPVICTQRPHLDAGLLHVDDEVREAPVLRDVGVGAARGASPTSARCASVVHTFWPLTTHSSPSRTARVARPATSEPAPGSLNSWHQISWLRRERPQEPVLHLLGAPRHDRRAAHADPDDVERPRHLVVVEHLVDEARLARRERQAGAVLGGPGRRRVARLAEQRCTTRRDRARRGARRACPRRPRRPPPSSPPAGARAATRGSARLSCSAVGSARLVAMLTLTLSAHTGRPSTAGGAWMVAGLPVSHPPAA